MELCGRWGFDTEQVWSMTPAEFNVYAKGGLAREREHRLVSARIESLILAVGGVKVSPLILIGEADDVGPNPLLDARDQAVENRQKYLADLDRQAEATHRRWLPRGIVTDVDDD